MGKIKMVIDLEFSEKGDGFCFAVDDGTKTDFYYSKREGIIEIKNFGKNKQITPEIYNKLYVYIYDSKKVSKYKNKPPCPPDFYI